MMKNLWLLICAACIWTGCDKREEDLTPTIKPEQFYVIQDNPADSVQHLAYEIYQKYGVPVFFKDTIGRTFVKTDIHGDSVFQYETFDLAWGFTGYSDAKYTIHYMNKPEEQMQGLRIVEEFLQQSDKVLHPFTFLIADSLVKVDNTGKRTLISETDFLINFRTVFLSGGWENDVSYYAKNILRASIETKIGKFPDDLAVFKEVSDKNWYGGKGWVDLDPTVNAIIPNPYDLIGWGGIMSSPLLPFSAQILRNGWFGEQYFKGEEPDLGFPPSFPYRDLLELRHNVRMKIGQFGFVDGNKNTLLATPATPDDDLSDYIVEMLKYDKAGFEAVWGEAPLVMKKYNIIYNILLNRMGVEL